MFFKTYFCQFKQWKKLLLIQLLTAFAMGYPGGAIALSLEDYCLSKTEPSEFKTELKKNPRQNSNQINFLGNDKIDFSQNNKKYSIKIDYDIVQLIDEESNSIIAQLELPLGKDNGIRSAYLAKDNWLYLSARRDNYMVRVDLENSKSYLEYKLIPKIYRERCSNFINWFDGGCLIREFSVYNLSNKVFFTGYKPTPDGQKWVTMAIEGGKIKILQTSKQIKSILHFPGLNGFLLRGKKNEILFYDGVEVKEIKTSASIRKVHQYIPKLRGVLLQGTKGEILFFDGVKIHEISSIFPRQRKRILDWNLAKISTFTKDEQHYSDERIFLTNFLIYANSPLLLMELKADLSLVSVSLPEQSRGKRMYLFRFPDDSLIWAIRSRNSRGSILAEIDGKFQNVISASRFHTIRWKRPLTMPISFDVKDERGGKQETYYIKRVTPLANCDIILDSHNTIELTVE